MFFPTEECPRGHGSLSIGKYVVFLTYQYAYIFIGEKGGKVVMVKDTIYIRSFKPVFSTKLYSMIELKKTLPVSLTVICDKPK